mgnify:FL=1
MSIVYLDFLCKALIKLIENLDGFITEKRIESLRHDRDRGGQGTDTSGFDKL